MNDSILGKWGKTKGEEFFFPFELQNLVSKNQKQGEQENHKEDNKNISTNLLDTMDEHMKMEFYLA